MHFLIACNKISPYLEAYQVITTQTPVYVYALEFRLVTPLSQNGLKPASSTGLSATNSTQPPSAFPPQATTTTTTFGLIASRPLLETVDFPIYTPNGEEIVHIELIKANVYLTPNQLRLIKTFHKFVFSNVLRMEGRGAAATAFLSGASNSNKAQSAPSNGCLICVLLQASNIESSQSNQIEIDWDMMKSVDGCTDKSFMRPPSHARWFVLKDFRLSLEKRNISSFFRFGKFHWLVEI